MFLIYGKSTDEVCFVKPRLSKVVFFLSKRSCWIR